MIGFRIGDIPRSQFKAGRKWIGGLRAVHGKRSGITKVGLQDSSLPSDSILPFDFFLPPVCFFTFCIGIFGILISVTSPKDTPLRGGPKLFSLPLLLGGPSSSFSLELLHDGPGVLGL